MKSSILLVSLMSTLSFAATKQVRCTFEHGYRLQGTLLAKNALKVTKIVNDGEEKSADDINNNPVKPQKATEGVQRLRYGIDALSGDPDYGDMYELFVPAKLESGKSVKAQLTYEYISRGESSGKDFVNGTCRIK